MAKKLIEVALPLDEINTASAREKSIRHGHPSTLHLWWARRPLAAARAVIFASLITDPGDPDYPWLPGQERDIERERERLHALIADLVQWENSTNEAILGQARAEIMRHTNDNPPPLLDPFAGGGSIPLEAQRLGLEAHASDLNPVAVLINKAMIEIPPRFAGQPPVNPDARRQLGNASWKGATGLAEDVRFYGKWMRDEAERRIGHLYPKVTLPKEQGGGEATVIAWLWARTVTCPNPACGATMPLISSFDLSKKKGKEAHVEPVIRTNRSGVEFTVARGKAHQDDTINRKGARCIICGTAVPFTYIRSEGQRVGLGTQLMAIVAEGARGRIYLSPDTEQASIAESAQAEWRPEVPLPVNPRDFKTPNYGLTTFGDLFTERQLVALTTFSDLVGEARERVLTDALAAGRADDGARLADGGSGAAAYADAVVTYLAFAVDRLAESLCSLSRWQSTGDFVAGAFGRQALPMVWDFAEVNPFSNSTRNFGDAVKWVCEVVEQLPASRPGSVLQKDATSRNFAEQNAVFSTDPPYYDNIGYADLSDFFYVWLKRSLSDVWSGSFQSLLAPKNEELVATPYRFEGGRDEANSFFETGLRKSFGQMAASQSPDYPLSIYYAFKQAESEQKGGDTAVVASTGWETMLEGLVSAGLQVTATWPMRTERGARMNAEDANALASSVVLACRVRQHTAPEISRQQFIRELRQRLAADLRPLQAASIAPVDLAQAAIGPGMAIYSQYSRVREATGEPVRVRAALAMINQALDEILAEQDEDYDRATRWAVTWYEQHGFGEGPYGEAETLARARDVAVHELASDGLVRSGRGKVQLTLRNAWPPLPADWHPRIADVYDWQIMQRLAQAAQEGQSAAAAVKAQIDRAMPGRTETAKELVYRVHSIADRKNWTSEALVYNTLVQNWPEIERLSREVAESDQVQQQTAMPGLGT